MLALCANDLSILHICFAHLYLQLAEGPALEACCDLLGVKSNDLSVSLTRKRIVTPSETIVKVGTNQVRWHVLLQ